MTDEEFQKLKEMPDDVQRLKFTFFYHPKNFTNQLGEIVYVDSKYMVMFPLYSEYVITGVGFTRTDTPYHYIDYERPYIVIDDRKLYLNSKEKSILYKMMGLTEIEHDKLFNLKKWRSENDWERGERRKDCEIHRKELSDWTARVR